MQDRDVIAIAAMQALISRIPHGAIRPGEVSMVQQECIAQAYGFADRMLAVRGHNDAEELREAHRMFHALWTDKMSIGGSGYRVELREAGDLSEAQRKLRSDDPNEAVLAAWRLRCKSE
jgi:hypothetical protein